MIKWIALILAILNFALIIIMILYTKKWMDSQIEVNEKTDINFRKVADEIDKIIRSIR